MPAGRISLEDSILIAFKMVQKKLIKRFFTQSAFVYSNWRESWNNFWFENENKKP